jgi:hypothetical protein
MELHRLDVALARRDRVAGVVAGVAGAVVLSCRDASSVMVAASLRDQLTRSLGVWVDVGDDYGAALAARDVATLSWLIDLDHVVVAGDDARGQADVVRALLTNDEVNFANSAGTLRGAYNRPAPPRPVRVWALEGRAVVVGATRLEPDEPSETPAGELTVYSEHPGS